jgi:hypothetical protein
VEPGATFIIETHFSAAQSSGVLDVPVVLNLQDNVVGG